MDDELGLLLDPQSLFPHCLSAEISQLPVPSIVPGQMKIFLLVVWSAYRLSHCHVKPLLVVGIFTNYV